MKRVKSPTVWMGVLPILFFVLGLARPASAQTFSGFYQVTNAQDQGNGTTLLTLNVDLANGGSADATNATVTLGDSVNPVMQYGSFTPTTVLGGSDVVISAQFLVPNSEYNRWGSSGVTPNLIITFVNSNGNSETDGIALTQAPVNTD